MSNNYTLKYRTFDTLLAEVYSDFSKYEQEDLIQAHQLIKIAKKCNYELGLRINSTREALLEVEKGRVKLPNAFFSFNFGMVCDEYEVKVAESQGTHIEERPLSDTVPEYQWQPGTINTCDTPEDAPVDPCDPCSCNQTPCSCSSNTCEPKPRVCLNCKGEEWELVQVIKYQTRSYKNFYPLRIISSDQTIECGCPNLYMTGANTAWIKDGWLYTNFDCGQVYINYQSLLEDDDGNILVPDHDLLNEFYEYAMKDRVIENLIANDIPVSPRLEQRIMNQLITHRRNAISLVRMPNFAELKKTWEVNRKAQYARYYDMFKSFPWVNHLDFRRGLTSKGTNYLRS